ncbi:histidine kinase [Clostridiales bacterium oral taxon 876 str. F0540]|nr:histidine kinase [Clostridiales bacterium oral taxon 876 str. F0540]
MTNSKAYFNTLRYSVIGLLFFDEIYKFNKQMIICFIVLIFTAVLFFNDLYRIKQLLKEEKKYYTSLLISILGVGILNFIVGGFSNVFAFFTLIELIAKDNIKIKKPVIYIHAAAYFLPNTIRQMLAYGHIKDLSDIFIRILIYPTVLIILFLIRSLKLERKEIAKLNEELKDYSEKVGELTVSKERNRVAQELHDSIGHSLMAISMHLDFLGNIIDKDTRKAKEILGRTDYILKESIEDLRDTVYKLKESNNKDSLESRIKTLVTNITIGETLNVNVMFDKNIEKVSAQIKEAIFTTVKERVTNSLKHGAVTKININIQCMNDKIDVIIEDDGKGCENILKSHGLRGIESRISNLGGEAVFKSSVGSGFRSEISIPIILEA